MNRRVWTLVFVLSISSLFTVRSAFPQGQTPSQRRAIDPPATAAKRGYQPADVCALAGGPETSAHRQGDCESFLATILRDWHRKDVRRFRHERRMAVSPRVA